MKSIHPFPLGVWAGLVLEIMVVAAAGAPDYTFIGEAPEQFSLEFECPAGDLSLAFDYQDEANHYALRLAQGRAQFVKVRQGREEALGQAGPLPPPGTRLTLKRRLWKMALVAPTEGIATAYDSEWTGGQVGVRASAGVDVGAWQVQTVESIWWEDDFMRAGEGGGWEPLSGKWQFSGIEGIRPDPRLSANPFSYHTVAGTEPGLSVVGYWFWDDYEIVSAVKPEGYGAVGLVAYLQDPSNFLLFRWTARRPGEPGQAELVRVVQGTETVVARAGGGFDSGQWYQMRLRLSGDRAEAFLDGRPVLEAANLGFSQGRAGLYAAGGAGAHFDDVRIQSWLGFQDDFSDFVPGRWNGPGWTAREGRWVPPRTGPALAWTGPPTWREGTWEAEVQIGTGRAGLVFASPDPQHGYLFRAGRDSSELVQFAAGQEKVLARGTRGLPTGQGKLGVNLDGGYVVASLEGQPVLEAFLPSLPAGRLGVYAQGTGVRFDRVRALPPAPEPEEPLITEQFTREATMAGWARAEGAWDQGAEGTYWHKGLFFNAPYLELLLTRNNPAQGSLALCLAASEPRLSSGYELLVAGDGQGNLWGRLARAGVEVARGQVPFGEGEGRARLRFAQKGRYVIASLDDQPFLTFQDPEPLPGHRVGIQVQGAQVDFRAVHAGCLNRRDYTFSTAPVDWYVGRGQWQVTERWKCSPQWSWFGCDRRLDAANVLWSKAAFRGDVLAEFYACIQMDRQADYSRPSDLNVTICGDGRDLSSGYSFIFGGWNNTLTRLLRREQVVAQTDQVLLPRKGQLGGQDWATAFHRHWFYIRVLKQGARLSLSVDGREAFSWEDPEPLEGGRIAFWTWDNGALIARARIWYQELAPAEDLPTPPSLQMAPPPAPQAPVITSTTHPTVQNDFETDLGTWSSVGPQSSQLVLDPQTAAGGRRSLAVFNGGSGGDFGVWVLRNVRLEPAQVPRLEFDYKVPPAVKVNFFLKLAGVWHEITFTDPEEPRNDRTWLGRIPEVQADDAWHHAEFDLLGALQQKYGQRNLPPLTEIALASRRTQMYLRCGFGGNYWGSVYHLDNFWLGGPGGTTADFTWAPPQEGLSYRAYRCLLDRNPDTEPVASPEQTEPRAQYSHLEPGIWYFHLQAQTPQGDWLPAVHHRILVGEAP